MADRVPALSSVRPQLERQRSWRHSISCRTKEGRRRREKKGRRRREKEGEGGREKKGMGEGRGGKALVHDLQRLQKAAEGCRTFTRFHTTHATHTQPHRQILFFFSHLAVV
jgi:hypothetical protein